MTRKTTPITPGSGEDVAMDSLPGNQGDAQLVKLVDGTESGGDGIGGTAAYGLKVDVTRLPVGERDKNNSSSVTPASDSVWPLPSGAATQATLAALLAALPASLGQKTMAASLAVAFASDQTLTLTANAARTNHFRSDGNYNSNGLPSTSFDDVLLWEPAVGFHTPIAADFTTPDGTRIWLFPMGSYRDAQVYWWGTSTVASRLSVRLVSMIPMFGAQAWLMDYAAFLTPSLYWDNSFTRNLYFGSTAPCEGQAIWDGYGMPADMDFVLTPALAMPMQYLGVEIYGTGSPDEYSLAVVRR